ncbi:toxin [Candidatus Roizmanbacteria bacterium]|nr:toxin [Candidatus Roizmanbacteria bacterium]
MKLRFDFNEEKNILLKKSRGINFGDILRAVKEGKMLDDIEHKSSKYKHQRVLVVQVKSYIYAVPYVKNSQGILFLKTLYPSRTLIKRYLKK